ncbi:MAG: hypothetical protein IVW53_14680 [Chloroflexi bacterium]|nr:hypothetical protein [Chloroflexota bacterium]
MWSEPLTTTISAIPTDDENTAAYDALVYDGDLNPIATVRCECNTTARTGFFGEMRIIKPGGGPKQTHRALILLTRASLIHAATLGVQKVTTRTSRHTLAFTLRASAQHGIPIATNTPGEFHLVHGELAPIQTHLLEHSDAHGHLA